MTDDLTTLLHRCADAGDFTVPDLDAIVATGDRRVRRRRAGLAGVLAAAAVALVATAVIVLPDPEQTAASSR